MTTPIADVNAAPIILGEPARPPSSKNEPTSEPDRFLALVAEHQELFARRGKLMFTAKFLMEEERLMSDRLGQLKSAINAYLENSTLDEKSPVKTPDAAPVNSPCGPEIIPPPSPIIPL